MILNSILGDIYSINQLGTNKNMTLVYHCI